MEFTTGTLLAMFAAAYLGYIWICMIVAYVLAMGITAICKTPTYLNHVFGLLLLYFGFVGFIIGALLVADML